MTIKQALLLLVLVGSVSALSTQPFIVSSPVNFTMLRVWVDNSSGTRYADQYYTMSSTNVYYPYLTNFTLNVSYDGWYNASWMGYNGSWFMGANNTETYIGRGRIDASVIDNLPTSGGIPYWYNDSEHLFSNFSYTNTSTNLEFNVLGWVCGGESTSCNEIPLEDCESQAGCWVYLEGGCTGTIEEFACLGESWSCQATCEVPSGVCEEGYCPLDYCVFTPDCQGEEGCETYTNLEDCAGNGCEWYGDCEGDTPTCPEFLDAENCTTYGCSVGVCESFSTEDCENYEGCELYGDYYCVGTPSICGILGVVDCQSTFGCEYAENVSVFDANSETLTSKARNTLFGSPNNVTGIYQFHSGLGNTITNGDYNTIIGKDSTINGSTYSAIVGGVNQRIEGGSQQFIAGGHDNFIDGGIWGTLLGGEYNHMLNPNDNGMIGCTQSTTNGVSNCVACRSCTAESGNTIGGSFLTVETGATSSLATGGQSNYISGTYSAIVGGYNNDIGNHSWKGGYSAIVGGSGNYLGGNMYTQTVAYDVIVGGEKLNISGADHSALIGGKENLIYQAYRSAIVGGKNNQINAEDSVISGGTNNFVQNSCGIINSKDSYCASLWGGILFGVENNNSGYYSTLMGNYIRHRSGQYVTAIGKNFSTSNIQNSIQMGINNVTVIVEDDKTSILSDATMIQAGTTKLIINTTGIYNGSGYRIA